MRILFLVPRCPYPPTRGGEITVFNFLRVLSRRHELSLVTFYDAPEEENHRSALLKFCARVEMVRRPGKLAPLVLAQTLLTRRSYAVARHASSDFAAAVAKLVREARPDVVQVETFLLGQYLRHTSGVASVLDMHNVTWLIWDRLVQVSAPWLRPAIRLQAARVRRDELAVCGAVDVVAPVSDADLAELRREAGGGIRAVVVTPGVDCDLFTPVAPAVTRPEILFVGSMSYAPNVDAAEYFCREVLPLVTAEVPDVGVSLVGANPAPSVARLASDCVRITGFVPDVRPYYAAASAVVVPLRVGGGIRMKILEGLALGAPMVSTAIGAEGLGLSNGRELLIADDPAAFAAAVVRLLREPALRAELAVRARAAAVARFSWDAVGETLTGIYASLARTDS
jgi:sugar transferase (PEP-CTERM/EpsH1 system associated)